MKKVAAISLLALLVLGPASAWATTHPAACSESDHDVMRQAMKMDNCHAAPCCVMGAPARGSDPAPKQVKRTTSGAMNAPASHDEAPVATIAMTGHHGGDPPPAAPQTTPILRR